MLIAAVYPFAFHAHPEVWLLVGATGLSYFYAVTRIGPKAVAAPEGVVTRSQVGWFVGGLLMLWAASDWPLHDLGENYLYAAHMLQHLMLSYFMAPMMLLAIPAWLMRLIIGRGFVYSVVRWFCQPVVAGLIFNGVIMVIHIPGLVNQSASNGALHYCLHLLLVVTALLMWMPLCGPIPEFRIGVGGQMIYLFMNSVVPTVPAGWLTMADGVVYKHYNVPTRVFGLSPTYDQQLAGVLMKVGGSVFLWTLVVRLFFRRFAAGFEFEQTYRRRMPDSEMLPGGDEGPDLTFASVTAEFARTPAATEPDRV